MSSLLPRLHQCTSFPDADHVGDAQRARNPRGDFACRVLVFIETVNRLVVHHAGRHPHCDADSGNESMVTVELSISVFQRQLQTIRKVQAIQDPQLRFVYRLVEPPFYADADHICDGANKSAMNIAIQRGPGFHRYVFRRWCVANSSHLQGLCFLLLSSVCTWQVLILRVTQ